MAKDPRDGARNALNNFYKKQADIVANKGTPAVRKERNKTPEKDVERECLVWMRAKGWVVNIYESKAVWNSKAENWSQSGMRFGTCDCMGNTDDGIAVAVEFKAPGALSSFNSEKRYLQRKFIVDRINSNSFACVVDSVKRLNDIFEVWRGIRVINLGEARNYLLSALPLKKTSLKDEKLFDDEE